MSRDGGAAWRSRERLEPFLPPELPGLEVVINHRRTGLRVRLSDTDRVELWRGTRPLAELHGSLLRELVAHHFTAAAIQLRMLEATAMATARPTDAIDPPGIRASADPEVARLALPHAGLSAHLTALARPIKRRRDAKQGQYTAVGAKIRGIRTRLGLTQKQFAQQLEIGKLTIVRYENGQVAPRLPVLERIAAAGIGLGVTMEWLLGGASTNGGRL